MIETNVFGGNSFLQILKNSVHFNLTLNDIKMIFISEHCSFTLKPDICLIFHTLRTDKNYYIWALNKSAMDDRKLEDYAYEKINKKYVVLKRHVKKCPNYLWKKSFRTWFFAIYFAGIKFPNFVKKTRNLIQSYTDFSLTLFIVIRGRSRAFAFQGWISLRRQ